MFKSHATLKAARRQLQVLRRRLSDFDAVKAGEGKDPGSREALVAEIRSLETAIALQGRLSLDESPFAEPHQLADLPDVLINARLARGMTQKELAEFVGVKMQQFQQYEDARYQGTSLRRLVQIAEALGVDIRQASSLRGSRFMNEARWSNPCAFPVGAMARRGWLGLPDLSLKSTREASAQLDEFFTAAYGENPVSRKRYVRSSMVPHEGALTAWEAHVVSRADRSPLSARFDAAAVTRDWLRSLTQLSSRKNQGSEIKAYLAAVGIQLLVEPNLPGMHIDGAAVRTPKNQHVIALTLENWRAEWFWLTLMHELAHLVLDVTPGRFAAVFDELAADGLHPFEEDADVFGREAIVPTSLWRTCRSQFEFTTGSIRDDARKLGVATAVVVARAMETFGDRRLPNGIMAGRDIRPILQRAGL